MGCSKAKPLKDRPCPLGQIQLRNRIHEQEIPKGLTF